MNFTPDCEREEDGRWLAEVSQLPGVLAYEAQRTKPWPRQKCLHFAYSLSGSSTANPSRKRSTSRCPPLHEPVAVMQSTARSRCSAQTGLASEASNGLPSHARARGLARFCVCLPRRRRNWPTHVGTDRKTHRPEIRRPLAARGGGLTETPAQ